MPEQNEPDYRFTLANERSSERPKSPSALSTSRPMALNAPVGRRLPRHQYGTTLTDTKAIQGCHDCKYHRQDKCKTCLLVIALYRYLQERSK